MIYTFYVKEFVAFVGIALFALLVTRLCRTSRYTRPIGFGIVASAVGYLVAPLLMIFTNTLPPDYLTLNPKLGCICPVGVFYIVAQLIASVAICFTVGFWCGMRQRRSDLS